MGNSEVRYKGGIQLEFDAYDAWKNHTGNFEYFFDGSKLCLCKTEDPEDSCIVIELKIPADKICFVQCKRYHKSLPQTRIPNRHENWNLGTALYACHTFASREYSTIKENAITSRNFARDLVRYMAQQAPSDQAIRNPMDTVAALMKWSNQLGITMYIVSNAQNLYSEQ